MKREEALTILDQAVIDIFLNDKSSDPIYNMIDRIYDDFESQTCDNCKHWAKDIRMCDNKDSFAYDSKATVVKGDGCNKWEQNTTP